jgi:hypothetical protein
MVCNVGVFYVHFCVAEFDKKKGSRCRLVSLAHIKSWMQFII